VFKNMIRPVTRFRRTIPNKLRELAPIDREKNLLPYVTFYAHLSLFVKQPRPLNVVSRRGTSRDRFFQISWSGPSSPSVLHTPIRVNRSATSNHVLEHAPYRRLQHVIEHSALPRLTCRHCFLYLAARWSVHICCVHVATCAHL